MSAFERAPELRARYRADVSALRADPDAVVRPRDARDVAEAIREAAGQGMAVLPVGGQTSTTGASVPLGGGLVLDMSRLPVPIEIDRAGRRALVGPGAILADLRRAARVRGLELPVDPTSEQDCTVGGAVATDASGPSSFAHGSMGRWVRGLTFIDGTGKHHRLRRRRVRKCAMGPVAAREPVDMLIGSEGIFGVLTALELRLVPVPPARMAAFVGFGKRPRLLAAVMLLRDRRADLGLRAIEWLDGPCCRILAPHAGALRLPDTPAGGLYLDLTADTADTALSRLEHALQICAGQGGRGSEALVLPDRPARARFAALRHRVPDTLNRRGRDLRVQGGAKISTDWSVPPDRVETLIMLMEQRLPSLGINELFAFGHIGDGHPHLNILVPDGSALAALEPLVAEQLRRVVAAGGSPVSEHGIGKLKRDLVRPHMPAGTIAAIRAWKALWDPAGVMAPGNVLRDRSTTSADA